MKKNLIVLVIFALWMESSIKAQSKENQSDFQDFVYESSFSGGLTFHTNGWGINARYENHRNVKTRIIYDFDLLFTVRHPKEVRVVRSQPQYDNARPFVYGKKNHLMMLRPQMGLQHIIADKQEFLGIKIAFNWSVGPGLALLKPVYLEVQDIREVSGGIVILDEIVIQRYDPDRHSQPRIYGGASFFEGLGEIALMMGGSFKAGLEFDLAKSSEDILALELGVMVDAFPGEVPIFAKIDNKRVFVNLFATGRFGLNW